LNVQPRKLDVAASVTNLDLAVVGNCRTAALVNPMARIVWWCFPQFDGDPVFSRLLAGEEEKGFGREDVTERLVLGCPGSILIVPR